MTMMMIDDEIDTTTPHTTPHTTPQKKNHTQPPTKNTKPMVVGSSFVLPLREEEEEKEALGAEE